MASEKYLLPDVSTGEEPTIEQESLPKDSCYCWFICICGFLTQVFILGVLHAFGVFFVEFVNTFGVTKSEAGKLPS